MKTILHKIYELHDKHDPCIIFKFVALNEILNFNVGDFFMKHPVHCLFSIYSLLFLTFPIFKSSFSSYWTCQVSSFLIGIFFSFFMSLIFLFTFSSFPLFPSYFYFISVLLPRVLTRGGETIAYTWIFKLINKIIFLWLKKN